MISNHACSHVGIAAISPVKIWAGCDVNPLWSVRSCTLQRPLDNSLVKLAPRCKGCFIVCGMVLRWCPDHLGLSSSCFHNRSWYVYVYTQRNTACGVITITITISNYNHKARERWSAVFLFFELWWYTAQWCEVKLYLKCGLRAVLHCCEYMGQFCNATLTAVVCVLFACGLVQQ